MVFNKQIYEAACKECYSSLLPVAVINTVTTSNWGGKGLFQLTLSGHTPSQQEFKAGTEAETIEDHGLLSHSCSANVLIPPRPTCPEDDTAHTGLIPSPVISNQENVPRDMPQTSLTEAVPQLRFPLTR